MSNKSKFKTNYALINFCHYDARKVSLLYGKILFNRFDRKSLKKSLFNSRVIKFDDKFGRFVDLKWKNKGEDIIFRVTRTKQNKYIVYKKTIIYTFFVNILLFIYNSFEFFAMKLSFFSKKTAAFRRRMNC